MSKHSSPIICLLTFSPIILLTICLITFSPYATGINRPATRILSISLCNSS